jgi:hypothetical protein
MNVRFEGNNGHDANGPLCRLMTRSGHLVTSIAQERLLPAGRAANRAILLMLWTTLQSRSQLSRSRHFAAPLLAPSQFPAARPQSNGWHAQAKRPSRVSRPTMKKRPALATYCVNYSPSIRWWPHAREAAPSADDALRPSAALSFRSLLIPCAVIIAQLWPYAAL